jgi:Fic family protein
MGHPLFRDQAHKDALEARNGRIQYRRTIQFIERAHGTLKLTPKIIRVLHRNAIKGIYSCAGQYRDGHVKIPGSRHKPPDFRYVPGYVDDMCDQVNERTDWDAVETGAYLLWRVNWIHPFGGGNGRTARVVSYLGLCVRHGSVLPGEPTIPEQIVDDRELYLKALRDADDAWNRSDTIDVSKLQILLNGWLTKQLASVPPLPRPSIDQPRPAPPPFPGAVIQSSSGPPLPPTDE